MLPVNARDGVLFFASVSTTIYIAAVKDLALMGATSHTLNLTWAPMDARVCMLENITVVAVRPGHNQPSTSCIVFKESLSNFCTIESLMPNEVYTVHAIACMSDTSGCSDPEANIPASTHPAGKRRLNYCVIRCQRFFLTKTSWNINVPFGYTVVS